MSMLCFLADVVPPLCCQVGQNKRCGSQQDSLAGMMPLWAACATRRCGTVIRGVQAARLQMLKWSKHIGAAAVRSAFACLPHPCCWWQLTTPSAVHRLHATCAGMCHGTGRGAQRMSQDR